jgi:hypothetical protein
LEKLHKEQSMPSDVSDMVRNALRIYEHIFLEEIENGREFFQKVDGDMIPIRFFLTDLE